jgi:hypothetical protein
MVPAAVLVPSSIGWPKISRENFSTLHKSDGVVHLLKHLPCIDLSQHEYVVAPDTHPVDSRGKVFQEYVTVERAGRCLLLGDVELPEQKIRIEIHPWSIQF